MSIDLSVRTRAGGPAPVANPRKWPPAPDPLGSHIRLRAVGVVHFLLREAGALFDALGIRGKNETKP